MKLKIKKINKKIKIPINSEIHRIEQIKNEIANCTSGPELCEVEVFDMWDELRSNS